jgi:NADH:ubiquinone oxidoreductase subunit 6 (subunit J)
MFPAILFFIFAGVLIGAALGVILSRNPVYSALLLVLCFFNSAVIWVLLDAEFLGIVLVLVYVGAVMVLFLFVVMMLDVNIEQLRKEFVGYWPLTVAVAGFVVFAMINVIVVKHLGGAGLKVNSSPPIIPTRAAWASSCLPATHTRRRSPQSFCWWPASPPSC